MNLYVTGGAGFIGSNFLQFISDRKLEGTYQQIYVIDKLTYASDLEILSQVTKHRNISFIELDIRDFHKKIELNPFDQIINFAAETHVDRSIYNPDIFIQSNIAGLVSILESMVGIPEAKILHISTDEVYGSLLEGESEESDAFTPSSVYSASKAASELMILAYRKTHQLRTTTVRPCNNFGPGQNLEKFIPTVISACLNNLPVPLYGNGQNVREWIYVKEVAEVLFNILQKNLEQPILNLGSGIRLTNYQIIKKIEQISGREITINYVEDRKGHDARYALNSELIKNSIGWESSRKIEEHLLQTFNWYAERHIIPSGNQNEDRRPK